MPAAFLILNNAAYHLQQTVEKVLKGALECVGITVCLLRSQDQGRKPVSYRGRISQYKDRCRLRCCSEIPENCRRGSICAHFDPCEKFRIGD